MTSCQCLIYALCNILTNLKANMRSSVFCSWNNSYNLRKYACKLHTTSINEPVLYNNTPIWTHHVKPTTVARLQYTWSHRIAQSTSKCNIDLSIYSCINSMLFQNEVFQTDHKVAYLMKSKSDSKTYKVVLPTMHISALRPHPNYVRNEHT